MLIKISRILIIVLIGSYIMGCGGSGSSSQSSTSEIEKPEEQTTAAGDTAFLVIEGNDLMQYNLDKLEAVEGQVIKLTLKHVGSMSAEVMGHNWVLLQSGTDKTTFGIAAVDARETNYIPQDMLGSIIAHTKVIGGGEETTITFDAPKMGYYDFICSFPGHWGVMQGTLTIKPA